MSILTLFAISNYAQIETYESASPKSAISSEEVQKQYPDLSLAEQRLLYRELIISGGKAKTWQERKSLRLESFQKNTTYPMISLSSDANHNRYLIGDTLYSVRNEEKRSNGGIPIFILLSTNDSIRISRLPVGEYFQVIDMIVCKEDRDSLFNSFNNKTFVEEKITIYEGQKPCQLRRMVQVGTEKLFLGFEKTIKAPIWEAMYKNITPIYVLKKNDTIYYAEWFKPRNRDDSRSRRDFSLHITESPLYLADISDFVSVKSYNMLKDMYIGKELVPIETGDLHNKKEFIEQVEESSIWTMKKLLLKGDDFYAECASDNQEKKGVIKKIKHTNYISNNYFGGYVPDYVDTTTVDTFSVFTIEVITKDYGSLIYSYHQDFILKSEADALITKWKYEEEQERLADEKKQEQYRANMIQKYGEKYGNLIAKGEICIGMTKDMCRESLGRPEQTNKTTNVLGEVEVWTYISNWVMSVWYNIEEKEYMYVTFMDGKVTSITE